MRISASSLPLAIAASRLTACPGELLRGIYMTIDGVWTAEAHGVLGWNPAGIYVLENGRIRGGDNRMFCTGPYSASGDTFETEWAVQFFGQPLTVFGETKERIKVRISGALEDGVIDPVLQSPDRPEYQLRFRLTRRLDLPAVVFERDCIVRCTSGDSDRHGRACRCSLRGPSAGDRMGPGHRDLPDGVPHR